MRSYSMLLSCVAAVAMAGCRFGLADPLAPDDRDSGVVKSPPVDLDGDAAKSSFEDAGPYISSDARIDAVADDPDDDGGDGDAAGPTLAERCADICERSIEEDYCGTLHDPLCGDVECGACSGSKLCAPLGDHGVCIACEDGPHAVQEGDVHLSSPKKARALRGIREITGSLTADLEPGILGQLVCLERVGWHLGLENPAWNATDLRGLARLTEVGGSLDITGAAYDETGHEILHTLKSLEGLEQLQSIGGSLALSGGEYADLSVFSSLSSVGGDLYFDVYSLERLGDLTKLASMNGVLRVRGTQLEDFSGLSASLTGLRGLDIERAYSLKSLLGLPNVETYEGIRLSELTSLQSLRGLDATKSVSGHVDMYALAGPINMLGLRSLTHIAGNLSIRLTKVGSLLGLEQLTTLGGTLIIDSNENLESLNGLRSLTSARSIGIASNRELTSIAGLRHIAELSGALVLDWNPKLESLSGLDALSVVHGYVHIRGLSLLRDLTGLSTLEAIGGDFVLAAMPALTSVAGLDALHSVGDTLYLWDNDALQSVAGLSALQGVGVALTIFDNAELPMCAARALSAQVAMSCTCPPFQTSCVCSDDCSCSGNDNSIDVCTP